LNNEKMALSYLHGAKSRLESAKNSYNGKDFPYAVRQSQECVELSLNEIEKFAFISRKLRREREPSMYGDEELRLTPEELYHEYDAKVSLEDAISVYEKCEELLSERHV
jgi:HEPN domain-containing protein